MSPLPQPYHIPTLSPARTNLHYLNPTAHTPTLASTVGPLGFQTLTAPMQPSAALTGAPTPVSNLHHLHLHRLLFLHHTSLHLQLLLILQHIPSLSLFRNHLLPRLHLIVQLSHR